MKTNFIFLYFSSSINVFGKCRCLCFSLCKTISKRVINTEKKSTKRNNISSLKDEALRRKIKTNMNTKRNIRPKKMSNSSLNIFLSLTIMLFSWLRYKKVSEKCKILMLQQMCVRLYLIIQYLFTMNQIFS